MSNQARFDFELDDPIDPIERRDAEARQLAVDPTRNVALEASAGTGKTRVLVDRYIGLLVAGVPARHILAMTFTRKAAAEMRQRILADLARRHRDGHLAPALWQEIREHVTDISISTIDAFCLALLHEFPLEADVDPGFDLADESETPRLLGEALDRTLRLGRGLAPASPEVALLFAELGEFRLRAGLTRLIDRRLVTRPALARFVARRPDASIDQAVALLVGRLRGAFSAVLGGVAGFIHTGPPTPDFAMTAHDLQQLVGEPVPTAGTVQALLERVRRHLLTQDGAPRKRLLQKKADFRSAADYDRHVAAVGAVGPYVVAALQAYRTDINLVLARAVQQLFAIALDQYARTLRKYGVLDFSDVLERTLALLGQMDEFSRSRFKLEARYQHVLVDEFQDTSRAQWALVELLIQSWAAGLGLSARDLEPSIFIVGDRKQSIYGFRDADVSVLDEAARFITALRPIGQVRTAISRSFRSVRQLLAFVNDVFGAIDKAPGRTDAFRYDEDDVFPLASVGAQDEQALGLVAAESDEAQAEAVAEEIARLLVTGAVVRDRDTGVRRAVRPGDIGVLFRTREGHRLFEDALARRHVPYYVYKGLGFFDADEIKDVLALITFLARPQSDLHAAALLRSRVIHVSDEALKRLAPGLSTALTDVDEPEALALVDAPDRERLRLARALLARWLPRVDVVPPAEVLDGVLADAAYAAELGGPTARQARENLKKVRALVRRMQNRGYATLGRIVDHFAELVAGGDESNAIVDAMDAVNLMTTHAAKGLEFPIVFVANMQRGSGGSLDPIRVTTVATVDGEAGGPASLDAAVAIGDHVNEADIDADARDAEESKRLLYVALTRARDRLYLAATLASSGQFVAGKGGLGRTLPAAVAALFQPVAAGETMRVWNGPSGGHRFRVLAASDGVTTIAPNAAASAPGIDDLAPLEAGVARRGQATSGLDREGAWPQPPPQPDEDGVRSREEHLEAGVLVHRALARGLLTAPADADLPVLFEQLVRDHERVTVPDVPALVGRAVDAFLRLRDRPEVRAVFGHGAEVAWRRHELSFSLRQLDGAIVRGTVDCVVAHRDGSLAVLEFKTGRPRPEHQRQLDTYVEAVARLFSEPRVVGRLVYAS